MLDLSRANIECKTTGQTAELSLSHGILGHTYQFVLAPNGSVNQTFQDSIAAVNIRAVSKIDHALNIGQLKLSKFGLFLDYLSRFCLV